MNIITIFQSIDQFCVWFNSFVTVPATLLFFGAAVILTIKTGFIQFRGFPHFITLLFKGLKREKEHDGHGRVATIDSFHALFTAMASTIGMGNVVGPSVAIMVGGPGALFWLLVYIFFGAATKFVEVTFALHTRVQTTRGLIGGPMEYLKLVHPFLAYWYTVVMIFLFMSWSSLQANTLASVFSLEGMSSYYVGIALASVVLFVISGGARRVGDVASALVPLMFTLYVLFAAGILISSGSALQQAIALVFNSAFNGASAVGGFAGASVLMAMKEGIYRSIFITEAGLGTSSIAHAIADTKRPVDQGLLALFSMISDALLVSLSGLIVLVTGVWQTGAFRSTLIYEAFKIHSPQFGKLVLLVSIALFVVTTVIGNTFNGTQSFSALFRRHSLLRWYIRLTALGILAGALLPVQSMWNVMDVLLTLVAIPNIIGLLILSFTHANVLRLKE
ncbi:MAG: amino acid carrier protein [Candidatus Dependentiae bacterium]|nr:amino acid carrier protein [Candidatus Dependentiae bacterium]